MGCGVSCAVGRKSYLVDDSTATPSSRASSSSSAQLQTECHTPRSLTGRIERTPSSSSVGTLNSPRSESSAIEPLRIDSMTSVLPSAVSRESSKNRTWALEELRMVVYTPPSISHYFSHLSASSKDPPQQDSVGEQEPCSEPEPSEDVQPPAARIVRRMITKPLPRPVSVDEDRKVYRPTKRGSTSRFVDANNGSVVAEVGVRLRQNSEAVSEVPRQEGKQNEGSAKSGEKTSQQLEISFEIACSSNNHRTSDIEIGGIRMHDQLSSAESIFFESDPFADEMSEAFPPRAPQPSLPVGDPPWLESFQVHEDAADSHHNPSAVDEEAHNASLMELHCTDDPFAVDEEAHNASLMELHCTDNPFAVDDEAHNASLIELHCTDLPLQKCKNKSPLLQSWDPGLPSEDLQLQVATLLQQRRQEQGENVRKALITSEDVCAHTDSKTEAERTWSRFVDTCKPVPLSALPSLESQREATKSVMARKAATALANSKVMEVGSEVASDTDLQTSWRLHCCAKLHKSGGPATPVGFSLPGGMPKGSPASALTSLPGMPVTLVDASLPLRTSQCPPPPPRPLHPPRLPLPSGLLRDGQTETSAAIASHIPNKRIPALPGFESIHDLTRNLQKKPKALAAFASADSQDTCSEPEPVQDGSDEWSDDSKVAKASIEKPFGRMAGQFGTGRWLRSLPKVATLTAKSNVTPFA